MLQFFNQFLDFVRQGIGAIFRFVQAIWSWAAEQVGNLAALPWQPWPPWKLLVLVVIGFFVVRQLYYAIWEIWQASEKILAALATLMGVLIKTVPQILIAGLIALGGIWLLSAIDLSNARRPSFMQTGPGHEDRDNDERYDDRYARGR
jgi:hypothetical protein